MTTEPAASSITSVSDIRGAVVQVLAPGSFRDPAEEVQRFPGTGSGFIVDPDGIVVTNDHLVTDARAVEVRIGGDDEEIPAHVLGVSECNDPVDVPDARVLVAVTAVTDADLDDILHTFDFA